MGISFFRFIRLKCTWFGADLNISDSDGKMPLHYATMFKKKLFDMMYGMFYVI